MATWEFKGRELVNCSCDYGCNCQFNGLPDKGHCYAVAGIQIDEGHHGDTRLDGLRVAAIESGRTLVLHQPVDPDTGRPLDRDDPNLGNYYGWNWVFILEEVDPDTTRLIVRSRVDGRPRYLIKTFYSLLLELPHFVMERGMLNGIKERAEKGHG